MVLPGILLNDNYTQGLDQTYVFRICTYGKFVSLGALTGGWGIKRAAEFTWQKAVT